MKGGLVDERKSLPKLSVMIPVYNERATIEQLLQLVLCGHKRAVSLGRKSLVHLGRKHPRWMDALERVRIAKVLPFVKGRLLDLGCGFNNLVRLYGAGVGVDVYPWPGVNVLVGNSAFLPFPTHAFDTVTLLAALNHIPNRLDVLCEVRRVLADDGSLILTTIGPTTGRIAHVLFAKDERTRGGLRKGESLGMTRQEVKELLRAARFVVRETVPFEFHLNCAFIARKASP